MSVKVTSNTFTELYNAIEECERLSSLESPTQQQRTRCNFLLAKISLLKQGVNPAELRRAEQDRLLGMLGQPRLPERSRTGLDAEVEQEWRKFFAGEPVRSTMIPPDREVRANEAGTESISFTQGVPGGYFVPLGMYDRAFETMKQYDQVFEDWASNVVETDNGASTAFPVWDDVANASVQVSEAAQSTEVDIANFGTTQLNAYAFRSKIVAVSIELLEDSNFPLGKVLERVFAMRHARGVGAALISGSGVAAPTGLLTAVVASGAVPVIASGSSSNTGGSETGATSVGTVDIGKLYASLNPAYRPGAVFYMHDATLQYLAQLLDKQGRPVVSFRKGLEDDGDGTYVIMGKRVAVCNSMPTMGSAKNPIVFGNPLYFIQRRVPSSMYVRSFRENPTLVQFGLVGFESWLRVDSGLVAPNANALPYNYIQSHS